MTPRECLALGSLLATAEMAADALPRRSKLAKRLRGEVAAVRAVMGQVEPDAPRLPEYVSGYVPPTHLLPPPTVPLTNGLHDPAVAREQAEVEAGYCEHEIPRTKVCPVCQVGVVG